MEGVMHCSANYFPLTPISFLERSAKVYGDDISIVYGPIKYKWAETRDRCHRLASALTQLGVSRGDVVGILSPNIPAVFELFFGIPMAGGIICAITTNADASQLSDYISRANPKVVFVHQTLLSRATSAISLSPNSSLTLIPIYDSDNNDHLTSTHYGSLLLSGNPNYEVLWPLDELDPMSISFTSGTTGIPKGVIHCHRAAHLNTLATILLLGLRHRPSFILSMPMFHCNAWAIVWAAAAVGGNTILLPHVTASSIFDALSSPNSLIAGTVPILHLIVNATEDEKKPLPGKVGVLMGGTPVAPRVLEEMETMGFEVTHAFGQTETYCCAAFCEWRQEWDALPAARKAKLRSRQGVPHHLLADVDVKDPVTMESVPSDGETVGEVVYRGNNVMRGYLNGVEESGKAFRGGWFHSGDLAVRHPDGYMEMKDRMIDAMVTSDGTIVGTLEVEGVIHEHPAVMDVGVVGAMMDGIVAFVKVKDGKEVEEEEIVGFCRERLPEYKVPKWVVFDEMPLTATGKMRKAVLREKARELVAHVQNGEAV